MKTPLPRKGFFYGMPIDSPVLANGTWLESEEFCYPNGAMVRRAYADCEDGKRRIVRCGIADTFFSIPAIARINGKRIKGFVSCKGNAQGFTFTAYKGDK